MSQTFHCPNCKGPLAYATGETVIECKFCGSSVVVPESLRARQADVAASAAGVLEQPEALSQILAHLQAGRKIEAIKLYRNLTGQGLKESKDAVEQLQRGEAIVIQARPGQASSIKVQVSPDTAKTVIKAGTGLGCLAISMIIGLIVITVGVPLYFAVPELRQGATALLGLTNPTPEPTATPTPTPFGQLSLAFGQEGDGPGYFSDARTMSVDSQGRVFVGDYSPGRIQAFDANGSFLWQYLTPGDTDYVNGLAADLNGNLYALVGRSIHVLSSEGGRLLDEWGTDPEGIGWYDVIAVTPRGEVVAIHPREFVKFDSQGNLLLRVGGVEQDFVETIGVSEFGIRFTGLDVDGLGNLYLSTSGNFVLKLDGNGRLIDRLPGIVADDDIETIAVDGQGNIAWVYTYNPVISDQSGNYLGDFKSGFLSDAQFNLQGQLVGISRNPPQVEVYTLAPTANR